MNDSMQSVLRVPLNLLKKPRHFFKHSNLTLWIEKIVFINRFDVGVHQMRRQDQF